LNEKRPSALLNAERITLNEKPTTNNAEHCSFTDSGLSLTGGNFGTIFREQNNSLPVEIDKHYRHRHYCSLLITKVDDGIIKEGTPHYGRKMV
jgi:hypothetical protein